MVELKKCLHSTIFTAVFLLFCIPSFINAGEVLLVKPNSNFQITRGNVDFVWENHIIDFGDTLEVAHYELSVWSRSRPFIRKFHYEPVNDEELCTYSVNEIRSQIRRHGRYFWKIKATDQNGKEYQSNVRSFKVEIVNKTVRKNEWEFPYTLHLQWNHPFQTGELSEFIQNIHPNDHFKDYSEVGFVLHQKQNYKPYLHFSEKCYFISQVGIGFDAESEFQLHQNRFFALKPYINTRYNLFSTGIHNFSNSLFHWEMGMRWRLSPKGNVVLQTGYIPEYKIRYAKQGKYLRTWTGEGYEIGVHFTIPSEFIKTFSVFGMNVNLRKLPVYISYTKIHDTYSKMDLKMRRVTFSYQF